MSPSDPVPPAPAGSGPVSRPGARLIALDWMRGLVMALMTVDHASGAFNAGRLITDGARMYTPGTVLDPVQFLTRWMTHLCAPTFVFLAGVALALSLEARRQRGFGDAGQDAFLVKRGLLIAVLDPLWMSFVFTPGRVLLQVLYAIGLSFVCMVALRRLPRRVLLAGSVLMLVGQDALIGLVVRQFPDSLPLPIALLLTGGRYAGLVVAYPLLPWLGLMVLGYCIGGELRTLAPEARSRWFAAGGLALLAVFVLVRGVNGYGNVGLYRDDGSLLQWLHVSKYPPSLAFATLELGLMGLLLALFFRCREGAGWLAPLGVLGQTAFFFYLVHAHLLYLAAWSLGLYKKAGIGATWLASLLAVALLVPVCSRYGRYKAAHPDGWARYI